MTRSWTGGGIRESTQYVMFEKDNDNIVLSSEEKCRIPHKEKELTENKNSNTFRTKKS